MLACKNAIKRVYGFLSEFLLDVWLSHNKLNIYESKIGLIEEKAEFDLISIFKCSIYDLQHAHIIGVVFFTVS